MGMRAKSTTRNSGTGGARAGSEPLLAATSSPTGSGRGSRIATARNAGGKGTPPASPPAEPVSHPGAEGQHHNLKDVYGPLGFLKELFVRFGTDLCPSWAASLSFFGILSVAPIILCGLAVLGFLIHDPVEAAAKVQQIIGNFVPDSAAASSLVAQLHIQQSANTLMRSRGIALPIGILSLFWASLQIFVNASTPINAAFRTKETRGWVKLRVAALGLLLGAGALFLLSLVPSAAAQLLAPDLGAALKIVILLIGIAINAAMYTVIYRYLPSPSARVTWKAAAYAGVIVAVLWEVAKEAFGWYVKNLAHYDKMYGSLGGLVALIFWVYYSSMILLLGAEIAKLYQDAKAYKAQEAAA